jgi:hypothetical protein
MTAIIALSIALLVILVVLALPCGSSSNTNGACCSASGGCAGSVSQGSG